MLSEQLEIALGNAVTLARKERHELITVEHLLYSLLNDRETRRTIVSCGGDIEALKKSLAHYLNNEVPLIPEDEEPLPGLGFQRVLQRAIMHVQSSGNKKVKGNNILVAVFSEKESYAVYFLSQQEITRYDVVNYIAHGITKIPEGKIPGGDRLPAPDEDETYDHDHDHDQPEYDAESPLQAYTLNLNQLAVDGKIDPLIGRQKELERTLQILCRRRKNNPLFVGEAGVGKTAIAEGPGAKNSRT